MTARILLPGLLGLGAGVLVLAGLQVAAPILVPITFAFFTIALVLPLQRALESHITRPLAMLVTIIVTLAVVSLLGGMVVWGLTRVGAWLVTNSANITALYAQAAVMLEARGFDAAVMLAQQFDIAWLLRLVRSAAAQVQGLFTFIALMMVFVILGMMEVDMTARKLETLGGKGQGRAVLHIAQRVAWKLQRYMVVRTVMSVATGLAVFAFAYLFGLELALEWGVIAFALNYIPFIGPLVATALPALLAMVQFGTVGAALTVLVSLNVIQNIIGSYLEPRIAGAALAVSPFIVLLSVFFWAFLWGIAGAFIGIPIVIACLTACAAYPSTHWVAVLLSGSADPVQTEG
ncbi:AI-2E family transporter [Humitalea sp. 24SJ18S-53]|uniref:AI-2E family transporter n=1 Tax=Humitalea sp. 24SJ18S-53 TaxID=3422307 RepID=UPI003D66480B